MKQVTILIPTYNRITALVTTLTSLCFQTYKDFDIVISDQTEQDNLTASPAFQAITRILYLHGNSVRVYKNIPRLGIAQQRQFLLDKSPSPYSLFLDDDTILEPYVIATMVDALQEEQCGFVGKAVIGLSYLHDNRPNEEAIEFWEKKVQPEEVKPGSKKWQRHKLHNAANIYHVTEKLRLTPKEQRKYKVAWIGGCVLYDTEKLRSTGGFSFWKKLPKNHCGEDVLAQLRVMKKYGGCGLIPSGVYHQELPTTIEKRDVNAAEFLQSSI